MLHFTFTSLNLRAFFIWSVSPTMKLKIRLISPHSDSLRFSHNENNPQKACCIAIVLHKKSVCAAVLLYLFPFIGNCCICNGNKAFLTAKVKKQKSKKSKIKNCNRNNKIDWPTCLTLCWAFTWSLDWQTEPKPTAPYVATAANVWLLTLHCTR